MPQGARRALDHANRLIDELDRLAAQQGYPAVPRCDNGPELTCAYGARNLFLESWRAQHNYSFRSW
jgi:hypothetical protein